MIADRRIRSIALALILLVALAWRLNNIQFGLPNLWDPDEPIFMLIPLNMLTDRTFDPGWFGHPGSTTIYLIALIDLAVAGIGLASGRYANQAAFAHAAFNDPSMLFIPARIAMVLIGVGTVCLTYKNGRKLGGTAVGLIAAFLLAINPLHIAWSQVIRTDVLASFFMLGSVLFSIRAAERGYLKDYLLAGGLAGIATATKWPAATVFAAAIGAAASRGFRGADVKNLGLAGVALVGGIFVASPFIFIDWRTVLADASGEAMSAHLAHTSSGFLPNLRFYVFDQITGSMGLIGLIAVGSGTVLLSIQSQIARWTLIPSAAAFLVLIATQHMVWSRWVLPLLPTFTIFAAVTITKLARCLAYAVPRFRTDLVTGLLGLIVAVPSLVGAIDQAAERRSDTRAQADSWAVEHFPPGSTVVLEHLELGLRRQPWKLLFPVGRFGCIDGVKALNGGLHYKKVQRMRGNSPIADLGNVSAERLNSCRADFAILTYYDLYRAEASRFPKEIRNYRMLLAGGRTIALFVPRRGRTGGPTVRIVALPQQ